MSGGHDAKKDDGHGGHEKKGIPQVFIWVAAGLVLYAGISLIGGIRHHYGTDRPAPQMVLCPNMSSDHTHICGVTVPGVILGIDSEGTACYDKRFGPDESLTRWINNEEYDSDAVVPFTASSILLKANQVDGDPYTTVLVEYWVAPPGYTCDTYPKPSLQKMLL